MAAQLVILGGLVVALNVVNYTLLSYMPTYLEASLGLTTDHALLVPIIGMLFMMIFVPFAGAAVRPDWPQALVVDFAAGLFLAGDPALPPDGHRP